MRDEDLLRDILFGIYIFSVVTLAFVYFTVPEREIFIENQLIWWQEFFHMVSSFL